nr:hypothetical protein Iba_chr15bCG8360 [Ipomoea batatas]
MLYMDPSLILEMTSALLHLACGHRLIEQGLPYHLSVKAISAYDQLWCPCVHISLSGSCDSVYGLVYPSMGSMKTAGGRCQCEVYSRPFMPPSIVLGPAFSLGLSRLCIFGLNDDEDIAVDVSYTSTAIYSRGSIVIEQGVNCKRNRNDKRVVKVFSLYAMLC